MSKIVDCPGYRVQFRELSPVEVIWSADLRCDGFAEYLAPEIAVRRNAARPNRLLEIEIISPGDMSFPALAPRGSTPLRIMRHKWAYSLLDVKSQGSYIRWSR